MKPSKRDSFRVSETYQRGGKKQTERIEADSGFDEIVVGDWLHLERMHTGLWWLRLGDREADIQVNSKGKIAVHWRPEGF